MHFNPEWLGVIAYGIAILGFLSPSDQRLRTAIVIACALNAGYFLLLDMQVTAAVNVLTALRIGVTIVWRPAWLGVLFIAGSLAAPWVLDSGDWIAAAASVTGTIAVFWLSGLRMRMMMLSTTSLLLLNALVEGAVAGAIGEGAVLLISFWRVFRWEKRSPGLGAS